MLKNWEEIPQWMKCPEVRFYYDILNKKKVSLILKRLFDIIISFILLFLLAIPFIAIALIIALDSPGGVFYRQERITAYGRRFRIHKFRTMIADAEKIGPCVTVHDDSRITGIGMFLRKYRLDELPQLIDVINGNMSFVGTRPEVSRYVKHYTPEMKATLLLPAGITSEASIHYKDEAALLDSTEDIDYTYIEKVLPDKMKYNLEAIEHFSFFREIVTMFHTVFAVVGCFDKKEC